MIRTNLLSTALAIAELLANVIDHNPGRNCIIVSYRKFYILVSIRLPDPIANRRSESYQICIQTDRLRLLPVLGVRADPTIRNDKIM